MSGGIRVKCKTDNRLSRFIEALDLLQRGKIIESDKKIRYRYNNDIIEFVENNDNIWRTSPAIDSLLNLRFREANDDPIWVNRVIGVPTCPRCGNILNHIRHTLITYKCDYCEYKK